MKDTETIYEGTRPPNLGGTLSLIYLGVVGIFILIVMTSNMYRVPERLMKQIAMFDDVLAFPLKVIVSPVTATIQGEDLRPAVFVIVRIINCFLCGYFIGWLVGRIRRADASGAVRMNLSLGFGVASLALGGYLINDGLSTQSNAHSNDHLTPWISCIVLISLFLCSIGVWLLKQSMSLRRLAAVDVKQSK